MVETEKEINVVVNAPPQRSSSNLVGELVGLLVIVVILGVLNPSELDMKQRVTKDGWVPVEFARTNLIVCNWVRVTGFNGGKATYFGIGTGIFKLPWSDE